MVGKETAGSDTNRNLFDTTLSYAATPRLSLMANFDYGKEGAVEVVGARGVREVPGDAELGARGRYEYLDDTKGGFMTIGAKGQSLTLTSDHLVAGGLRARLEYRTDLADQAVFPQRERLEEEDPDDAHRRRRLLLRRQDLSEVTPMMDLVFVVVTLVFFFVSWLYVRACDRV